MFWTKTLTYNKKEEAWFMLTKRIFFRTERYTCQRLSHVQVFMHMSHKPGSRIQELLSRPKFTKSLRGTWVSKKWKSKHGTFGNPRFFMGNYSSSYKSFGKRTDAKRECTDAGSVWAEAYVGQKRIWSVAFACLQTLVLLLCTWRGLSHGAPECCANSRLAFIMKLF